MESMVKNMNYHRLRQEGMRLLEHWAGPDWTDFNSHDPGITILEQVCYALTDLHHRIGLPVRELVSDSLEQNQDGLMPPDLILPCRPVTLNDLRRLIIDVPGVHNAWIEPIEEPLFQYRVLSRQGIELATQPVLVKGRYRVLIEKSDIADLQGSIIRQMVMERLHAHRGLCEDFEKVQLMERQNIRIETRIEVRSDINVQKLLEAVLWGLTQAVSPTFQRWEYASLRRRGMRVDEIFEGPATKLGRIRDQDLASAQRKTKLFASDLVQVLMDIPGVLAVKSLTLGHGAESKQWVLDLNPILAPKLDFLGSKIDLESDQMTVFFK